VPEDKVAVLGLVTTKSPRRESVEELQRRVEEAQSFVELERLAISPQCGFSTSTVGNAVSVDDEERKLSTLVEAAGEIWG
jgi:5-methyltetrahydropteroyltriglutamate--homocysteine methyltransferase